MVSTRSRPVTSKILRIESGQIEYHLFGAVLEAGVQVVPELGRRVHVELARECNPVGRGVDLPCSDSGLHQARPSQASTSARVMLLPLTGLRAASIRA